MSDSSEHDTKAASDAGSQPLARLRATLRSRAYYRTLIKVHAALRPLTYLEIGIRKGDSLALATTATVAIGIDPEPLLTKLVGDNAEIYAMTSDDFFRECDLRAELGGRDLDLAFIDGMHRFEFVLRDFANVERNATRHTVVILHDCLPVDAVSAARERTTSLWTGDVWKAVAVLRRYRPDLRLTIIDAPPSGLVIVEGLDPASTVLDANYDAIVAEYTPMGFDGYEDERAAFAALVSDVVPVVQRLAAHRRADDAGVVQ